MGARNALMKTTPQVPDLQARGADAILTEGEGDAPIEAWQPDDFDHYTDVGLLRSLHADADRFG